jgi:ADP-heptose:LPS heptosyltransferase
LDGGGSIGVGPVVRPVSAVDLHRALEGLGSDFDDLAALADVAEAARAEAPGATQLIYLTLLLRIGAAPDARVTRQAWRERSGILLQTSGGEAAREPRPALDTLLEELAVLPRISARQASAAPATGGADPATAALRLLQALHCAETADRWDTIAAAVDVLARLAASPLGGKPDASPADRAYGVAIGALRSYLLDVLDLAQGPQGSPELLCAVFHAHLSGAGDLGLRAADRLDGGCEALAALQLALGERLTAVEPAVLDRALNLVARRAPAWLRRDIVDELADLGLRAPLRRAMDAVLRAPDHRRDREELQRLRDAGLDLGDLELAWDAQTLLAQIWSDDANERQALGDIAAYRRDYLRAEQLYEDALRRSPDLSHARSCLEALRAGDHARIFNAGGFGSSEERRRLRASHEGLPASDTTGLDEATQRLQARLQGRFAAPELAPSRSPRGWMPEDGLHLRRLGARRGRSAWGELPVMAGVEAIRGFLVAAEPPDTVEAYVSGRRLARGRPTLHLIEGRADRLKASFNLWLDLSDLPPGRYEVELRLIGPGDRRLVHHERVQVQPPVSEADFPTSDTVADPPSTPDVDLAEAINARPSAIRAARRQWLETRPQSILVLRADQLGDLVCSVPALRRLRDIFQDARITGLVTPANAGLARSLGLFDELVVTAFATDPVEHRRVMPTADQEALRADLTGRRFDLAVDLADNSPSRYLLTLSGASRLFGARGDGYGFLDMEVQLDVRDPVNRSPSVPASNKMLAMVEALGAAMADLGATLRRSDLEPARLRRFGLTARGYVVLHTGARLAFSRWPHFPDLARLLLQASGLQVVLVSDEPMSAQRLGPGLVGHPNLLILDQPMPFDDLDLLLSYAAAVVGNDSGPKHLASLRGTEVVSLHCARNNWNEWGQENTGVVISRRLPCAGCQIQDYPDECGRDFVCMTAIRPEEVATAVLDRVAFVRGADATRSAAEG